MKKFTSTIFKNTLYSLLLLGLLLGTSFETYAQLDTGVVVSEELKGLKAVHPFDMDNDGDLDLLIAASSTDYVAWLPYEGNLTWGAAVLVTDLADKVQDVWAADLDGDGDMDVLSAEDDNNIVAWHQNDGAGLYTRIILSDTLLRVRCVRAGDIDGDGDMDVLATGWESDRVVWFDNTDGAGTFSGEILIGTPNAPADGALADIDGDGDLDVVSNSKNNDDVMWYENTDGLGTFGSANMIEDGGLDKAYSLAIGDIDSDGDLDVICSSEGNDIFSYYNDGVGNFTFADTVDNAADDCREIKLTDLDGDGDLDLIMGSNDGDFHAWYENDMGMFGPQTIFNDADVECYGHASADFDEDGDMDVITIHTSSTSGGLTNKVRIFENICGFELTMQPVSNAGYEDTTLVFMVEASGMGHTFQWMKDGVDLVDGGNISGATSNELTVANITTADAGIYDCRVFDEGPCYFSFVSDTASLTVYTEVIIDGLKDLSIQQLEVFPNPVSQFLTIKELPGAGVLTIHDTRGSLIKQMNIEQSTGQLEIDLQNTSKGIYLVTYSTENEIFKSKIVKE